MNIANRTPNSCGDEQSANNLSGIGPAELVDIL